MAISIAYERNICKIEIRKYLIFKQHGSYHAEQ